MSRLFIVPLIFLVATCAPKPQSTSEAVASDPTTSAPVSKKSVDAAQQDLVSLNTTAIVADSSLYIGEIWTFPETGELYTPVYYHDHLKLDGLYESLTKQTDSVVYEDIERRRSRLPSAVAGNYFNLSGLDSISVYKKGRLVGKAKLVRVEYFRDLIESQFVAVFKPIELSTFPDPLDYCISAGKNHNKTVDVTYEDIEDEQLTKSLLDTFVPDSARVWDVSHTRIMPYHSVYSSISMHSRLLLVETNAGQSHILKDLKEDWFVSDITPLHLESNGKPILLLTMGVNETDMIWTSLAMFWGEEYVFPENNRVKEF